MSRQSPCSPGSWSASGPPLGIGRVTQGAHHTRARSNTAGPVASRTRGVLVIGQIAMSFVLLVSAGLLIRSLGEAERLDLGYEPQGLLNVTMDVSQVGYDAERKREFHDELLDRVRDLPAVESASIATFVPHGYAWATPRVHVEGRDSRSLAGERPPLAGINVVSNSYFENLRIPILRGRALDETDDEDAPPAAVISETLASNLWDGEIALGRRLSTDGPEGPWTEVVGISRDGFYGLLPVEGPQNFAFLSSRQRRVSSMTALQVRTSLDDPRSLAPAIEQEIRALEPDLPLLEVTAQEDMLLNANGVLMLRVAVVFAAVPGLIGLLLSAIGIYGVLAYSVTERTAEMGIRMALGAQRMEVLGQILRQAANLIAVGLLIGVGLSLIITRLFQPILSMDPVTFVVVSVGLSLAAFAASYVPARRATKVDPLVALRHE